MYQIYKRALKNEIYLDEFAFIHTGLSDIVSYSVIRPYITQKFIKKNPIFFKFIFRVISYTWLFWNSLLQTILFFKYICISYIQYLKIVILLFMYNEINLKYKD